MALILKKWESEILLHKFTEDSFIVFIQLDIEFL